MSEIEHLIGIRRAAGYDEDDVRGLVARLNSHPAVAFAVELTEPAASESSVDGSGRWWVQSDEGDGAVIQATSAIEAVEKWAASERADIDDGQTIEAIDTALIEKFVVQQTNEIADDDFETEPEYVFRPAPPASGRRPSTEAE